MNSGPVMRGDLGMRGGGRGTPNEKEIMFGARDRKRCPLRTAFLATKAKRWVHHDAPEITSLEAGHCAHVLRQRAS